MDVTTDIDFADAIAGELTRTARRAGSGKIIGRCQCVSYTGNDSLNRGYQCGAYPIAYRDGRAVCSGHLKSKSVTFVEDAALVSVDYYANLIKRASEADPDFATALTLTTPAIKQDTQEHS